MSSALEQVKTTGEQLVPAPRPTAAEMRPASHQAPAAAVAVHLAGQLLPRNEFRVHLASSDRRAEEIGRALAGIAPDVEVLVLPPWDCLPYDRASPSREIMGRRMAALRRLAAGSVGKILITAPESLLQRTPPTEAVSMTFNAACGKPLDREALFAFARATGYVTDDRVDEPGEIAIQGEVVDVFPADAAVPTRIVVDVDGRVNELRTYDPLTQRTAGAVEALTLGPASELIVSEADDPYRLPGVEHQMSAQYASMPSLFDLVRKAKVTRDPLFDDRLAESLAQIADAFEAHQMLRAAGDAAAPDAAGLYLSADEVAAGLEGWRTKLLDLADVASAPSLAGTRLLPTDRS
jgi:transcription-repair coupling factor (superfamily II helicase)